MHRFYHPSLTGQPGQVTLFDEEAMHAIKVLRIQPDQRVTLLDGKGRCALGKVTSVSRKTVELNIEHVEKASPPIARVILYQAVTKSRSMDWIVEKATELGAHAIQPVLTDHSVPRLDASDAAKKTTKWQRTAIESLKQCGGTWLPEIHPLVSLSQSIAASSSLQGRFFASLASEAPELRDVFPAIKNTIKSEALCQLGIWVGPEGDFSPTEIQLLQQSGVIPTTLGQHILRSETAAICALSSIHYELRLRLHLAS